MLLGRWLVQVLYIPAVLSILRVQPDVGVAKNATDIRSRGKKSVYFVLAPFVSTGEANYQHMAIALGEGLVQAGHEVRANVDYWRPAPGGAYLFRKTDEEPYRFDAVVVTFESTYRLPSLFWERVGYGSGRAGTKVVMLDWSDGDNAFGASGSSKYDVYYKASYSTGNLPEHPKRSLKPSAFYLTERIVEAAETAKHRSSGPRRLAYLWAHKAHMHPVRRLVEDHFLSVLPSELVVRMRKPNISSRDPEFHLWSQSGGRHDPQYFAALQQVLAMDCSGGMLKAGRLIQWDSFKLWEAFASGIAVLLPELEHYGARLPLMPTPWVHYVPMILEEKALADLAKNISRGSMNLASIGKAGRDWALENYSPKAFAERFIQDVFVEAQSAGPRRLGSKRPTKLFGATGVTDPSGVTHWHH